MEFTIQQLIILAIIAFCVNRIWSKAKPANAPSNTESDKKIAQNFIQISQSMIEERRDLAILSEKLNEILDEMKKKATIQAEILKRSKELENKPNRSEDDNGEINRLNQLLQSKFKETASQRTLETETFLSKYENIVSEIFPKLEKISSENGQIKKQLLSKLQQSKISQEKTFKKDLQLANQKIEEAKESQKNLKARVQALQEEKHRMEQKVKNIKAQATKFKEKLQNQLKDYKQRSTKAQQELNQLKSKLSAVQADQKQLRKENQTNTALIAKLRQVQLRITMEKRQLQNQLASKRQQIEKLQKGYQKLVLSSQQETEKRQKQQTKKISALEAEIQKQSKIAQENKKWLSEIAELKQKAQQKEQVIESLKANQQKLSDGLKQAEAKLAKQKQTLSSLKKEFNKKETENYELIQKINNKQRDYQILQSQAERVKSSLEDTRHQLDEMTQNTKKLEEQVSHLKQQKEKLSDQIESLTTQVRQKNNQIQLITTQRDETNQRSLIMVEQVRNEIEITNKFDGDILEDKPQYKQFLKESIQKYTEKKILKTKKIYTSEKDLNFSFHKYVDQVPDIIVLVKTVAGFYLAGFSESPVSSKAPASKGGLIVALNNKKCFPLLPNKRSVTYDTFFLIIGNSEIRLKNQEWKVFSNFGIANSFFNNLNCGVNDLLGEGPNGREVPIVDFEVHKIIFA